MNSPENDAIKNQTIFGFDRDPARVTFAIIRGVV